MAEHLAAFVLEQLFEAAKEHGNEAFEAGVKNLFTTTANGVAAPLAVFKIIGADGMVAERASGLVRTTTLETTFIVVGDPFKLEIVSITPPGGSLRTV